MTILLCISCHYNLRLTVNDGKTPQVVVNLCIDLLLACCCCIFNTHLRTNTTTFNDSRLQNMHIIYILDNGTVNNIHFGRFTLNGGALKVQKIFQNIFKKKIFQMCISVLIKEMYHFVNDVNTVKITSNSWSIFLLFEFPNFYYLCNCIFIDKYCIHTVPWPVLSACIVLSDTCAWTTNAIMQSSLMAARRRSWHIWVTRWPLWIWNEIPYISNASQAFETLRNIWKASKISIKTNLRLFRSNVHSTLLYGPKSWKMTTHKSVVCQNRCLRRILRTWPDTISNVDLQKNTSATLQIKQQRWRWIGNTFSMHPLVVSLRWTTDDKRSRRSPKL